MTKKTERCIGRAPGLAVAASVMLAAAALGGASAHAGNKSEKREVVQFHTMYGVDGPFVNSTFLRGVLGDELPWAIEEANGSLDSDGHLSIHVKGLVFTSDPQVPPAQRGINDEPTFRALVSCVTESGNTLVVQNVVTGEFRATRSGDSNIRATLNLPDPCVAPIVFVLSGSEDKWFAVMGNEN